MPSLQRSFLVVGLLFLGVPVARGEGGDTAQNRARLDEGRKAISSMRETYAYVLRKEERARTDHDSVLLNTLHQINEMIVALIGVADHSFDNMRVAISSNEAAEAIDGELETIMLCKTKVDQARNEADRSVGIKALSGEDAEKTSRSFLNDTEALSESRDPVADMGDSSTIPVNSGSQAPPASASTLQ